MILSLMILSLAGADQVHVTARPGLDHVPQPAEQTAPESGAALSSAPALTTDEQIAAWIAAAPRADAAAPLARMDFDDAAGGDRPERRIRGTVSAAVGSHDYRGVAASVTAPVGENGWVSLNYSQSEGGPVYRPYGRLHDYERFGPYGIYGPGGALEPAAADPWLNLNPGYGW